MRLAAGEAEEEVLARRRGLGESLRLRFGRGERLRVEERRRYRRGGGECPLRAGERERRRLLDGLEDEPPLLVFLLLRGGGEREDEASRRLRLAGGERERWPSRSVDGERRRLPFEGT